MDENSRPAEGLNSSQAVEKPLQAVQDPPSPRRCLRQSVGDFQTEGSLWLVEDFQIEDS